MTVTDLPLTPTLGEPAGIGSELTFAAWVVRRSGPSALFAIDDPERLERLARHLSLDVPIASIALPDVMLFHAATRRTRDAVLGMYDDQALIRLKTIDISQGVDVSLGLSFASTSPDHGAAFDVAGTGDADPAYFLAAIDPARDLARRRGESARLSIA